MAVDILAIAAHPDDIELTCAGTLVQAKARGRRFGIVDLTRGEMGTRGEEKTRHAEAQRAAEILGAVFRETLDCGDGGLVKSRENELAIIDVIRREKHKVLDHYQFFPTLERILRKNVRVPDQVMVDDLNARGSASNRILPGQQTLWREPS